jgi:hypothetical protein
VKAQKSAVNDSGAGWVGGYKSDMGVSGSQKGLAMMQLSTDAHCSGISHLHQSA